MRSLLSTVFVIFGAAMVCAAQSSTGSSQSPSSQTQAAPVVAPAPASQTSNAQGQTANKPAAKPAKKKKVWTEDDLSKVGGSISVVGDSNATSSSDDAKSSAEGNAAKTENSSQNSTVQGYRDQIRQLQAQLDATDKKLDELRNFKADNGSASGGINPNNGYSMTPVSDQIKQLEDKKKQIQDQIDSVMDEARRRGIEPGQLR